MRGLIFVALIFSMCFLAKAQSKVKYSDTIPIGNDLPYNDDDYTKPAFPGGLKQFYNYLTKNIHYPKTAIKNHIGGTVYLIFVIKEDGSIGNIKLKKGVSKEINAEAFRVLKSAPKWIPGTHRGRPVPVLYIIPMRFQLPKKGK